jgi:hypothetical protein
MRHDGTDSDRDISLGRNDLPKSSLLRILSGQTVEISNRDLEPLRNGEFYARLKPRVIEWLAPIWKEATQLHASSMTVDLASSRMSCGRTPCDFNGALSCFDLTLQRWWEEIFGWKPNPRSRWKRAAPTAFCGLQRLMSSPFCLYKPRPIHSDR